MVTNVLGVFVLAVALMVAEGSWGKGKVNDMSNAEDLTNLYNSKVYEADRMMRPMEGQSHSGVRYITTPTWTCCGFMKIEL
ncbi:hypothetical protein Q7C36_007169 [Tachysurus vachellii]|uniref:Uncharacterized protein n=1 Tax=Tachysurus vachellii TaxID=175792 RepID=A0AA88NE43_TACVA|nr:hypothetical protein Q7C36_007169 [Tachysurus vachellii]